MKVLTEHVDIEAFFRSLAASGRAALLLDYDGTLAPFRVRRGDAVPYPHVRELLSELDLASRTRVVIVSGRTVAELLPLLDLDPAPEIWASHGLEHRQADGTYHTRQLPEVTRRQLSDLRNWSDREGLAAHAEVKPSGLAFHWRGVAAAEAEKRETLIRRRFADIGPGDGLLLCEFDGGLEIRVKGVSKGDAVRTILAEIGERAPTAFLGDDLTDEDAFVALRDRGLSVLVRRQLRNTAADMWLSPPEELLWFLRRWLASTC